MAKVTLLILFNHNYEANLEKLDKIYQGRFSSIYYIMPFYQGKRADVITVYENSYYFQGYVSKALEQLVDNGSNHYMVIGDDLLLNPEIDEDNYDTYFKVSNGKAFVPEFFLLNDPGVKLPYREYAPFWFHNDGILAFNIKKPGIEVTPFLPAYEEAERLLARHGIKFTPEMSFKMFYRSPIIKWIWTEKEMIRNWRNLKLIFYYNLKRLFNPAKIPYPMVGSYSDCVIIPKEAVKNVIKYCGIFASLDLFVEVALPTAIAFSAAEIVTEKELDYKGKTLWEKEETDALLEKYDNSLAKLSGEYPEHTLYIHPVKLSKLKF